MKKFTVRLLNRYPWSIPLRQLLWWISGTQQQQQSLAVTSEKEQGTEFNNRCLISNAFTYLAILGIDAQVPFSVARYRILYLHYQVSVWLALVYRCSIVGDGWTWVAFSTHVNFVQSRNMFRILLHVFCYATIGYLQLVRTMAWWLTCIWGQFGTVIAINALHWTY